MEKKTTKYTAEGFQALVDELNYLKGEKTEEVKKNLAYARSLGDFSENSELDAAKDEQGQVAARIAELEELIKNAEIISESDMQDDVVNLGSTVTVYDYEFDEEVEYSIVGTNEADPMKGKISDKSPIGSELIGKTIGDEITVSTPGGEIKLKVVHVTRTKTAG
ncbi:MAG: transcription elongation factor GreA [Clostridia bacterium]|nr:transcription elongation factor GreA [Clostridia bacterium]MBQ8370979.1 transcription elongation factor GreA [Clostridia bacterium]